MWNPTWQLDLWGWLQQYTVFCLRELHPHRASIDKYYFCRPIWISELYFLIMINNFYIFHISSNTIYHATLTWMAAHGWLKRSWTNCLSHVVSTWMTTAKRRHQKTQWCVKSDKLIVTSSAAASSGSGRCPYRSNLMVTTVSSVNTSLINSLLFALYF